MQAKSFKLLSARQWIWLIEAWLRLPVVRLLIRFGRASWLQGKLRLVEAAGNKSSSPTTAPKYLPMAVAMHESVRLAARVQPGRIDCLPRSIVLADMLRARSHGAQVTLGVARQGDRLASHAWVELEGEMVAEPESVNSDFSKISSA